MLPTLRVGWVDFLVLQLGEEPAADVLDAYGEPAAGFGELFDGSYLDAALEGAEALGHRHCLAFGARMLVRISGLAAMARSETRSYRSSLWVGLLGAGCEGAFDIDEWKFTVDEVCVVVVIHTGRVGEPIDVVAARVGDYPGFR